MSTTCAAAPMSPQMTQLELSVSMVFGHEGAPTFPCVDGGASPRQAFEAIALEALLRPPCVVSFSGGRDSSAVLAVATTVARRHGVDPPIPVTLRFPGRLTTDESQYQCAVVERLRLDDWICIELDAQVDVVGPIARAVLRRHGVLWPPNSHFHVPMLEHARGGSILTGFGGDEMLSPGWAWERINQIVAGQIRPQPKDALRGVAAYGPRPLRRRVLRGRLTHAERLPWLTDDGHRALRAAQLDELADEPVRWDDCARWWWRSRYRQTGADSLSRLAADFGATAHHPFADPSFIGALAADRGRTGFSDRTTAMQHLFGDLLPSEIVQRETKAEFSAAFWTDHARSFVAAWDGTGLPEEWVRPQVLRHMWHRELLDGRTFCLLQSLALRQALTL